MKVYGKHGAILFQSTWSLERLIGYMCCDENRFLMNPTFY